MRKLAALLMIPLLCSGQTIVVSGPVVLSGNLNGTSNPNITTSSPLPNATQNVPYTKTLICTGGATPYIWTQTGGTLPSGFSLTSGGVLQGTDSTAESQSFTARCTDAGSNFTEKTFSITVNAASGTIISNSFCTTPGGGNDGPAALPLVYPCTSEADTPRTGGVVSVGGGSLQLAYNSASCGADIQLTAGNSYTLTSLTAKSCPDSQWIWIRTAPSASLPSEGTPTNPCFSNTATLPGYKDAYYNTYACSSAVAATARITVTGGITNQADHIRWENIEIRNTPGVPNTGALFSNMIGADKQVFDRVWGHGEAHLEVKRFAFLAGASHIYFVDGYYSDFHCISVSGTCTQPQFASADSAAGPFGFVRNFISSGGEHILFGGGGYNFGTPSDILIAYNTFFRPFEWNPNCTTSTSCPDGAIYDGGSGGGHPYDVQNIVELKNAQRVLLVGNHILNNWGGFSQVGNAITLTPKNQAGGSGCAQCFVSDVTEYYDRMENIAQMWQLGNTNTANGWASGGHNYSIHDVVGFNIGNYPGCYGGCSTYYMQIITTSGAPTNSLMHDVQYKHVTAALFAQGGESMIALGGPPSPPSLTNLIIQDSIVPAGKYGIQGSGGGTLNCATSGIGITKLTACWLPYTFTKNGIPWGNNNPGSLNLGATNLYVTDQNAVGYTNIATGNLQLLSSSPFHNQASDGTDLGANISAVTGAIANAPY